MAEEKCYRPKRGVFESTLACNLRCRHCGSSAGKARSDELTTQECRDGIQPDTASSMGENTADSDTSITVDKYGIQPDTESRPVTLYGLMSKDDDR